jgi:RNA polymerase sigma-70 factor, ECF subfamily
MDTHQETVRRTCFRFVGNRDDADDLTQDVFIQVHASLRYFRAEAELSTWIYRIAVNACLDFLRRQRRRKRFAWLLPLHDDAGEELVSEAADSDPHRDLEEKERRVILRQAIGRLPDGQRTALILREYEGLPSRDIAAILEVSVSAVEALLHRARKKLHADLYIFISRRL